MGVPNATWQKPFGADRFVFMDFFKHSFPYLVFCSSIFEDSVVYREYPVTQVSHRDATEYCAWASGGIASKEGGLRLPNEKEW